MEVMMKKYNLRWAILIIAIFSTFICACRTNSKPELIAPFSDASWNCNVEEMIALEGNSHSSYDSVYGGTTYSYSKDYDGYKGTIKYMFDQNKQLMCIAWAYGCDNENELFTLYEKINQTVNETHGKSNYNANGHSSNYGNVWYLKSGDIILSTMVTAENKALQYAYLNPLVSNSDTQTETD